MKLPLYLKISVALTCCLVVWAQFQGDSSSEVLPGPQTTPAVSHPAKVKKAPAVQTGNEELADLFPVYAKPVAQAVAPTVAVVPEVDFPFQLAGIWLSDRQKIIIVTDGMRNWLLCDSCGKQGFIQPGDLLTSNWRLQAIEPDLLRFEELSGHVEKSIELNSLKIK